MHPSVFERVRDKMKEHNLSDEEFTVLMKAKEKMNTHMKMGALAGLIAGGIFARSLKFRSIGAIALCAGASFTGSQMGIISGGIAGIRMLQTIPPAERNQKSRDLESADGMSSDYEMVKDNSSYEYDHQYQSQYEENMGDEKKFPLSAWDKVRERAKLERKQKQQKNTGDNLYTSESNQGAGRQDKRVDYDDSTDDATFNFPRTREDLEEISRSGKIRTNQFGDVEIRHE
ncbi:15874_t:CDS:2 [Acaulospora morrowiae]|uniref:15874_t:CDS:1 n=1 Tax=Acaulospora morrowiae TaxID=94023 RepID=A0A9N8VDV8_9GLOM|nr:15874_t:CDS:2 [Acaulospora morrowiae]